MNYQKLDSALAIALNEVENPNEPSLVVFVHTNSPLDADKIAFLESSGITGVTEGKDIFTATLSVNAISELSQQAWVQYLKLSQKLRLINR
ncbi:hypothetical protein [Brunnivagina elsteri]|uniref:Uncharacterized protein n=1 Tax=Brunnivagina elsteri CCALA 953 TaxID=987040 RepID=A0A2A2TQL2_9CYAN|nr:hypothetical protein [Calothrix elsteri]PAX60707.1 hypothetical protein CK510_00405 [Calothrix elsteri CCALA 953]